MRPLDHLVLPVADLITARQRLSALGFTVAPDGLHPFGTGNCCVYFADQTFLEPLAIIDRDGYENAAAAGNRFVLGDRTFRDARGAEGFSAVVYGTADAASDHVAFAENGCSAGKMLDFSRSMVLPDGSSGVAGFRLAFAGADPAGGVFAFTCQRINVPPNGRTTLTDHDNGVLGIREAVFVHRHPHDVSSFLRVVTCGDATVSASGDGLSFASARLTVLTPAAFVDTYGLELHEDAGLTGGLIMFSVASMVELDTILTRAGIGYFRRGPLRLVPPLAGQGVAFAFSEV
ncbi:VOC family protein [Rhizobium sp. TRM95796]|uniref:VOC family protein n=1 Tax=Rhizobium sp. TRM95796 TaxID=2979862 RepID=UPI0021E8A1DA|nr:VOC family protein [Rhizobium sp. TRM95796]MCV3764102.1 VOC family protein [Rhizobium sp. TRM95796]